MNKLLIVVDMQNDFVTGSLGTKEAQSIIENMEQKIKAGRKAGVEIIFTRDTHGEDYLTTQEGEFLPVVHCVKGTKGWAIIDKLQPYAEKVFDKPTFGSLALAEYAAQSKADEIELIGVCTDICVISNALLLKAYLPEIRISVDAACCAGVTQKSHQAALETMGMCQIKIH